MVTANVDDDANGQKNRRERRARGRQCQSLLKLLWIIRIL